MKRLIIILILMAAAVYAAGCSGVTGGATEIVCNEPYIRYSTACCLDTNANAICDRDEGIVLKAEEPEAEEEEEETADEPEQVVIPEIAAEIPGFEDFDIIISDNAEEDTVKMAIKLARMINYGSDILPKSQFDISDYERIYLIKEKDATISQLDEYIIAIGNDVPADIASQADDLAEGIGHRGSIKKIDSIDFTEYEYAIYLVTRS